MYSIWFSQERVALLSISLKSLEISGDWNQCSPGQSPFSILTARRQRQLTPNLVLDPWTSINIWPKPNPTKRLDWAAIIFTKWSGLLLMDWELCIVLGSLRRMTERMIVLWPWSLFCVICSRSSYFLLIIVQEFQINKLSISHWKIENTSLESK